MYNVLDKSDINIRTAVRYIMGVEVIRNFFRPIVWAARGGEAEHGTSAKMVPHEFTMIACLPAKTDATIGSAIVHFLVRSVISFLIGPTVSELFTDLCVFRGDITFFSELK